MYYIINVTSATNLFARYHRSVPFPFLFFDSPRLFERNSCQKLVKVDRHSKQRKYLRLRNNSESRALQRDCLTYNVLSGLQNKSCNFRWRLTVAFIVCIVFNVFNMYKCDRVYITLLVNFIYKNKLKK